MPAAEGQQRLDLFKQVAAAPTLTRIGAKLDFSGFNNGDLWIALLTFLFVDFADTTSTMFSMASFLNNFVPGFVRPDKVLLMPEMLGLCRLWSLRPAVPLQCCPISHAASHSLYSFSPKQICLGVVFCASYAARPACLINGCLGFGASLPILSHRKDIPNPVCWTMSLRCTAALPLCMLRSRTAQCIPLRIFTLLHRLCWLLIIAYAFIARILSGH